VFGALENIGHFSEIGIAGVLGGEVGAERLVFITVAIFCRRRMQRALTKYRYLVRTLCWITICRCVRTQEVLELLLVAIFAAVDHNRLRKSQPGISIPTIQRRGSDAAHSLAHQSIRQ
jgi:hypothetical protein